VFNATFSNISAISWRPVLVVEEAGVPGENHRPWESNCSGSPILNIQKLRRVAMVIINKYNYRYFVCIIRFIDYETLIQI
jgi:hypothetical protein